VREAEREMSSILLKKRGRESYLRELLSTTRRAVCEALREYIITERGKAISSALEGGEVLQRRRLF